MVSGYKRFIHVVSSSNPIRARLPREIVESLTRLYLLFFRVSFFLFVVFLFRPFFVVYRSKRGWWKRSAGNDIISACFPAVNTVLLLSLRRFVTVKWTTFINSLQHSISYWFTPFSCYFPCRNNILFQTICICRSVGSFRYEVKNQFCGHALLADLFLNVLRRSIVVYFLNNPRGWNSSIATIVCFRWIKNIRFIDIIFSYRMICRRILMQRRF